MASKVVMLVFLKPAGERAGGLCMAGFDESGLKGTMSPPHAFRWPELSHVAIPNAREAGKHRLVVCHGRGGNGLGDVLQPLQTHQEGNSMFSPWKFRLRMPHTASAMGNCMTKIKIYSGRK